ncbi:MAG: hypothetical protein EAX96_19710 [Candidatus Lokiarchaeota archaeon]|nr:hypothetical protein [Candidatus Lokiarchaeota archaeon]
MEFINSLDKVPFDYHSEYVKIKEINKIKFQKFDFNRNYSPSFWMIIEDYYRELINMIKNK